MSTEPKDAEREAFVAWSRTLPGHPFAGAFANLMWNAWQARASVAAAAPEGVKALEAWHAEADRLRKCFEYAPSGMEQMQFQMKLSAHLHKDPFAALSGSAGGETATPARMLTFDEIDAVYEIERGNNNCFQTQAADLMHKFCEVNGIRLVDSPAAAPEERKDRHE